MMSPALRKFMLTAHVTASVGWIGAVIAYLALVLAAMLNQSTQLLHAVWLAMELIGWYAIVPLSVLSLLSGLIMALGTKWGLFQHYWVLFSLALTIFASVILLNHMQSVSTFAALTTDMDSANVTLQNALRGELLHGGIGFLVLLVIQVLNVYKPRGMTPYGWRKQHSQHKAAQPLSTNR